jgi:hypothetical protein
VDSATKELNLKKTLWKLAYAKRAMSHVLATCDFYDRTVSSDSHPMHVPLICSICVTYCRPFTDNEGVGMMSNTLTRHKDPKLQQTHDTLWASRMHFYAHSDATLTTLTPDGAVGALQQLHVTISRRRTPDGDELSFGYALPEVLLRGIVIPDVRALCQELDRRLDSELQSTMSRLFSGRAPEFARAMEQARADQIVIPVDLNQ